MFENLGWNAVYEPIDVPFNGYLPDFQLFKENGEHCCWIEVKPFRPIISTGRMPIVKEAEKKAWKAYELKENHNPSIPHPNLLGNLGTNWYIKESYCCYPAFLLVLGNGPNDEGYIGYLDSDAVCITPPMYGIEWDFCCRDGNWGPQVNECPEGTNTGMVAIMKVALIQATRSLNMSDQNF